MAGGPATTRARVSAMRSQVQASFGVIVAERGERDGDRALVAGRPQPHVDGIERPVGARRGQRGDEGVGRADEPLAGRQRAARRGFP